MISPVLFLRDSMILILHEYNQLASVPPLHAIELGLKNGHYTFTTTKTVGHLAGPK